MIKKFTLLALFLSVCFFCNAHNVEYQIIPLSSAGEEFDLKRKPSYGPNMQGQTIGYEDTEYGAVTWLDDPVLGRIILPKSTKSKYNCSVPIFLSDNGHVVGHDLNYSYIWSLESGLYVFYPSLGKCYLKAVNVYGEVVFDNFKIKGYYTTTLLTMDKKFINIGAIGGIIGVSEGRAINDFSQIVGRSEFSRDAWWEFHAFIWDEENGMRDLNDLIPQDSGWSKLTEANYITNEGLIVGYGKYYGESCEFLLIPTE